MCTYVNKTSIFVKYALVIYLHTYIWLVAEGVYPFDIGASRSNTECCKKMAETNRPKTTVDCSHKGGILSRTTIMGRWTW